MNRNHISWAIIIILFVAALGSVFYFNNKFYQEVVLSTSPAVPTQKAAEIRKARMVWVEIDFGNGAKRLFEGDIDGQEYSLKDSLQIISDTGQFALKTKEGKITSLAGIGGSIGEWRIYKNNELANQGIDDLTIKGGDKYLLRFEPR